MYDQSSAFDVKVAQNLGNFFARIVDLRETKEAFTAMQHLLSWRA